MIIDLVIISVILGLFIKSNKLRICISSVPAIAITIYSILTSFTFVSMDFLLNSILIDLSDFIKIELSTQLILCPIYIYNRKKQN